MARARLPLAALLAGGVLLAGAGAVAGVASLAQEQAGPAQPSPPNAAAPPSPAPADAGALVAAPANATGEGLAAAPPPVESHVEVAAAPPPEPAAPPEPLKRPRYDVAVMQATDKVTAETLRFEARVGETVRYKGLLVSVHACEGTAADEDQTDSIAHLEVISQPAPVAGRPPVAAKALYHGWMFANSASLHPLESPGYDVWLIACKASAPAAPAGKA